MPQNPPKKKQKTSHVSSTVNNAAQSPILNSNNGPSATTPCPLSSNQILQDFRNDTQPVHSQLTSSSTSSAKKRKLSETLGEEAAICVNSLREKSKKTRDDYEIFDGRDVVDLFAENPKTGEVEVKEAKGGKSQYGSRKGLKGKKPVKQCTLPYLETIADKMSKTNYKGRHSRVPCAKHKATGVVKTCKDCASAERQRRRDTGKKMKKAIATGKLRKTGVRGDYNKSGVKDPQVMTSWQTTTTGGTIAV